MSGKPRVAHVTTIDLTLRFLLLPQLEALDEAGFDVTGIAAPGPWGDSIRERGIPVVDWHGVTRAWDPCADARAFRQLVDIFRRERFDLVHTHTPKAGILGRIAARASGVPAVVNTVHGLYATPEDGTARKLGTLALEALAARASDLELYQSEEDHDWARRLHVARVGRSRLLGNGTDLDRFHPEALTANRRRAVRHEVGVTDDEVLVGTVCRFVPEKGLREFFSAARMVTARGGGVRFVSVGDLSADRTGGMSDDEIERAREFVIFPGWREDVRDPMAAMDVFVLASWREGVPRSAIEAAALGKPLVLTNVRGNREVGRHEQEALIVPPRDPAALAAAIERLAQDPALRERLGVAARRRAVERFDEHRVKTMIVDEYRGLLERKRRLPSGDPIKLRPAVQDDTDVLARLHRDTLPDAFLPTLGLGFLRVLYCALLGNAGAVTLVAASGSRVVGFSVGILSTRRFARTFLLRHGARAALAAGPRLLDPRAVAGAAETRRAASGLRRLPESQLLVIGVERDWQQEGIGQRLAAAVVGELFARGAQEVGVVTAAANEPANRLYERLGFLRTAQVAVHDGVPSNVWVTACRS